jgi:chromosomal replication initiator protein
MYLLNQDLKLTLVQVGNLLGGRDHTTVMHGVDNIKRSFDLNQKVREQVMQIRTELYRN